MRLILALLLVTIGWADMYAQVPESAKQYEKEYKRRVKKEYLNEVYIPKDLTDAFIEIKRLSDKSSIASFQGAEEDIVAKKLYFSLGRWMIVNWGFHGGSRLSHWLKTKVGVSHPEDQAIFIIRTFHRSLNKKELGVKELVTTLKANRNKERVKNKKIIKTEKRQIPRKE
ncbi:MAG: hypothetical protein ACI94Y_003634 [Maribacter sp.]|jgi:hypothetical protein